VHCAYCNELYQYSFNGSPYPLQVHGSWFFLPWHRLYLHFHERILISLLKTVRMHLRRTIAAPTGCIRRVPFPCIENSYFTNPSKFPVKENIGDRE
jgi:hypothetical protein